MPFYEFECENCKERKELLVKMGTEKTECDSCEGSMVKLPSFRTVSIGLPNGFAFTRSKSKKKE